MKKKGKVVAKLCICCGHHELGIKTEKGEYIQLKPDMICTVEI